MDAPLSGSAMAEALGNAFRLSSDRERHGQDAFSASPFSRLLITHVLSLAGDALVTLALAGSIFFSTSLHAARGRVALTLLITIAPFAIVAPLLGPIIDRAGGGRRAMVVATSVGRAVACFLMARYLNNSYLLYPAALVSLVGSKGYTVAKATLVPAAVQRPQDLVEANSKLAVSGAIAGFLIAIPGVAILKLAGAVWVLRLDTLLFLVCAASALRLLVAHPSPAEPGGAGWVDAPADAAAREREARVKPLPAGAIQVAAFAMGTLRLIVGFLTFLVAFGFRNDHAPAWWYGVVLAGSIGGNLVGAALAPWLRSRLREELILAGATTMVAVAGILALLFNSVHSRPAAALLAGIVGLAAGAAKLSFDALVQRHIPAATQGRAFGRFEAGFQLVWVVGGLLPVIIPMTLPVGFVIITVAAAFAAVVYVIGTRMARLGRLPRWWPGVAPPAKLRRVRTPASAPGPASPGASAEPATVPFTSRPPSSAPAGTRGPEGHRGGPVGPDSPYGPTVLFDQVAGEGAAEDGPLSPYGPTVLFDQVAGDVSPDRPVSAPPYDDAHYDDLPWMSPPPDLGIYPPPIDGPPPLGHPARPVPPPLAGPPPIVAPLAPRPPRPPRDPPPE